VWFIIKSIRDCMDSQKSLDPIHDFISPSISVAILHDIGESSIADERVLLMTEIAASRQPSPVQDDDQDPDADVQMSSAEEDEDRPAKKRRPSSSHSAPKKKRPKKAEGFSDEDDEEADGDYVGEEPLPLGQERRRSSGSVKKAKVSNIFRSFLLSC
jgi:hypothetical protein